MSFIDKLKAKGKSIDWKGLAIRAAINGAIAALKQLGKKKPSPPEKLL